MIAFIEKLNSEVLRSIERIESRDTDVLKKSLEASRVLGEAFDRLKQYIIGYRFQNDDEEIKFCIKMLMDTDAGTGFMHESFHKDDSKKFTRAWFAWQNTLFGELILKLVNDGKIDLLNSIH